MTVLALEFSSPQRSAAVLHAGQVTEAVETGGRGTNAFGLIERTLRAARIEREQVEVVAVGLGPGSYTGIRVAISLAQGWQLARGVKLLGAGSADGLAAQAQAEGIFGRVNVVIDAQRGEFYLATWEISGTERRQLAPLKIVPAAEIEARTKAGEICLGPVVPPEGRVTRVPRSIGVPRRAVEVGLGSAAAKVMYPRAGAILTLAAGRRDFISGDQLEPIYLREVSFVKAPQSKVW